MPMLKVVESTVFEIMGGGSAQPSTLHVGTKYLRAGRVKVPKLYDVWQGCFKKFYKDNLFDFQRLYTVKHPDNNKCLAESRIHPKIFNSINSIKSYWAGGSAFHLHLLFNKT